MSLRPDIAFVEDTDLPSGSRIRTESAATVRPAPSRFLDANLLPSLMPAPREVSHAQAISASLTLQEHFQRPHSNSDASRMRSASATTLGAPFDVPSPADHSPASSSGSGKTIRNGGHTLSHKRSWSDPYASIPISPTISATPTTTTARPSASASASHQVTTRVSFANDILVRRRSQRQQQRQRATSSQLQSTPTSSVPPSTWPRTALKTPSSSQGRSPDSLASSLSPMTPQNSDMLSFVPFTDSPITRRPRHHNSYDALSGTAPFPALPFTSQAQPYRSTAPARKLLERKLRKSSPGLLTAYELNATPASSSTNASRDPSPSPLDSRKRNNSSTSRSNVPIWQMKVTEELVRLSRNRSQSPELEAVRKSSSATSKENAPAYRHRKRSQPSAPREQKLASLFSDARDTEVEPVLVHVVSQESYDGGIDPYAIPLETAPAPLMEEDTQNPFHYIRGKSRESDKSKSSSSDSNRGGEARQKSTRRRQRKATGSSRDAAELKNGSSVVRRTGEEPSPPVPVTVAPSPSAARLAGPSQPISTSLPSMRSRTPPPSNPSTSNTTLRPAPKSDPLIRPSTPPQERSRTVSDLTPSSSPGDSPRRRYNSSVYEGSLFFTPRAGPPEGYVAPASVASSPLSSASGPSRQTSVAYPSSRTQPSALLPGQVRLVIQEEGGREEEAASLGKGKGKRLGPEDEVDAADLFVAHDPTPAQARQRKESVVSDDDVLGDLPLNPRKRVKLTSSAALVQSLTEAAEAGERATIRSQSPGAELRGILQNKGNTAPSDIAQDHHPIAGPSRPDSRRSGNVSFSLGAETPPASPSSSRPRSRPSSSMSMAGQSIPLMALITPRPASMSMAGYPGGYHLKEPKRYNSPIQPKSPARATRAPSGLGTSLQSGSRSLLQIEPQLWRHALPIQGWAFFAGFFLPVFWWIAALSKINDSDVERAEPANHTPEQIFSWRRRCRLVSVFSIIVYVPVITLAIIFGR